MINPQWFELPMSRTSFHGPKDVRGIEVRLYFLPDMSYHFSTVDQKYTIDMSKFHDVKVHFINTGWKASIRFLQLYSSKTSYLFPLLLVYRENALNL